MNKFIKLTDASNDSLIFIPVKNITAVFERVDDYEWNKDANCRLIVSSVVEDKYGSLWTVHVKETVQHVMEMIISCK